MQGLIDQVATASDVNAALAQFTPTAYQALTSTGIDVANQTGEIVNQRLDNLRQGGGALAFAGLGTAFRLLDGDSGGDGLSAARLAYALAPPQSAALAALDQAAGVGKARRMQFGPDSPWGAFVYGNALFARQGASNNAPESKFSAAGITAGIDRRVAPGLTLGLLGGFTRTNADLDTLGSTSRISTWLVGAYGSYQRQNWFVNGAFVYGHNSYDNTRIALGTSNTSDPKGHQVALQATTGMDFRFGDWTVTPELGGQ
jgi:uncharacterized protein with beta-barrel porin domain